jgi:molybdate transport system ATP-binding protein
MPADPPTLRVAIKARASQSQSGFALDVWFDAPPGITVFFGPSGSGKSTTLQAIAGLLAHASGRITLGDRVWLDVDAKIDVPPHERGVAYVFQSLALFPHMTAEQNVTYGMPRALPAAERRARAREMLARWKVPHLADRKPPTFSGGEAQRVALARAFAMRPRVLLLDEPFSAMDHDLRQALVGEVRAFVDELAIPAIHVTHHRNEARALGDRAVLLADGRVLATGTVEQLLPARTGADMAFEETPLVVSAGGGRGRTRNGQGDGGPAGSP